MCQRFLYNQKQIFSWIRQKMRNFPIDPHYKKSPIFVTSCLGKRIMLKFYSWLYTKRWHTTWKFQLEITSDKKVIAKKPLTNLYEMNGRFHTMWIGDQVLFYVGPDHDPSCLQMPFKGNTLYIWKAILIHFPAFFEGIVY